MKIVENPFFRLLTCSDPKRHTYWQQPYSELNHISKRLWVIIDTTFLIREFLRFQSLEWLECPETQLYQGPPSTRWTPDLESCDQKPKEGPRLDMTHRSASQARRAARSRGMTYPQNHLLGSSHRKIRCQAACGFFEEWCEVGGTV